ncbi:MAG TPA: dual specificity protein phosphatase family protein [Thermoplasmata archaeon]|nr:dual specificity protein phosphatase family protein [Thermoplasmata archaeon]
MAKAKGGKGATKKAVSRASEVEPGLFVGGWKDAVEFEGARFCVLDEAPDGVPGATHIPVYDGATDGANRSNLDRLAKEIERARKDGRPVIVFCGHGVRRSPLGAAWYLHRARSIPLDAAFDRIAAVRPQVERPQEWLGSTESLEE